MKLIGDIINELINSETSLETPLLKTKVLASRIGNPELLGWVEKEIGGYNDDNALPNYRQDIVQVMGSYTKGNRITGIMKCTDMVLPLSGLSEEQQDYLTTFSWNQGVKSLESLASSSKGSQKLSQFLSAESVALIGIGLKNLGNPDVHLFEAYRVSSVAAVYEILSAIRNRLLDFLLKLETEFGEQVEIEQLKLNKNKVTTIMNQTFYNSGDGIVVNTGDNSTLHVNISITKGDKDALRAKLLENNVAPADADELLAIVDEEAPNGDSFGSKVNSWIGKMVMKAANGSWQIAAGAAGSILATILQNYLGIKGG